MKRIILILALTLSNLLIVELANCQSPQKFNYQGIARDVQGNPLSKKQLALKLSVLPTADATVAEYEETQLVTTNEFGLYTLQIGAGTSTLGEMKTVKWETGNKYIKVAIDPMGGTNYVDAGTTQLLSVPYAIYADKAGVAKETTGSSHSGTRTGTVSSNAAHVAGDANYVTKFTGLNLIGKSLIYDNGTNVGIGTTAPAAKLNIVGASIADMRITSNGATASDYASMQLFNNGGTSFGFTKASSAGGLYTAGIPRPHMALFANRGSMLFNTTGNIAFATLIGTTNFTRMFIDSVTGNVGIGTVIPGTKLEVAGQVKITGGAPGAGKVLTSDATGLATWQTPAAGGGGISGSGTLNYIPKFTPTGAAVGNSQLFDNGTRIGLGTIAPLSRLHITAIDDSALISTSSISQDSATGNYFSTGSTFGQSPLTYGLIGQVTNLDYGAGIFGRGFGSTPLPFINRDCGVYGSANFGTSAIGILGSSNSGTAVMGLSQDGSAGFFKSSLGNAVVADSGNVIVNTGRLGVGTATPATRVVVEDVNGYGQNNGTTTLYNNGYAGPNSAVNAVSNGGGTSASTPIFSQSLIAGYQPTPYNGFGENYAVWGNATGNGDGGWGGIFSSGLSMSSSTKYVALGGDINRPLATFMGGNVGIGLAAPASALDVVGSTTDIAIKAISSNGTNNQIGVYGTYNGTVNFGTGVAGIGFFGSAPPLNDIGVYGSSGAGFGVWCQGKLKLIDGTEAEGRTLTTDATGTASWSGAIAFKAAGSASGALASSSSINKIFTTEVYDQGNAYNPVTGTFTAPYTGVYHFDATDEINFIPSNVGYASIVFLVNGNTVPTSYMEYSGSTPSYVTLSHSTDLLLTAGDQVNIRVDNNTNAAFSLSGNSYFSQFTGHLVR